MKKTLIITIITVIILALIGGGVFWYLNTKNNENTANDDSQVVQNEENNKIENNKEEVKNEEDPNAKYQGETIKEADGWKKYRNEYFGIEFRFKDEGDELKFYHNKNIITLYKYPIAPDVYLTTGSFTSSGQILDEYVNENWNYYNDPNAQLISIEKVVNDNGFKFFAVTSKGVHRSAGTGAGAFYEAIDTAYYIEYKNKDGRDLMIIYSGSSGADLLQQIVNSFNFINTD